jgi:peptide/nickel transport system permease protein
VLALLKRLLGALILFWLVVSITFVLVHLAPGDATALLVPPDASPADAALLRARLGLDAPIGIQYGRWASSIVRGDLGTSFATGRPVASVLADALPVSVALGGLSLLLSFVIGTAVGAVQAVRRGGRVDHLLTVATTTVYAAPSFWLALALVALFTYGAARWGFPAALRLPAFGMRDPAGEATGVAALLDLARHAVLPVVVLTAVGAGGIARYARAALADVVDADFVRTARAKGVGRGRALAGHALPVALPPLEILLALALPGVIAGSVFVESVFAWPGMGRAMLAAIASRDYPVVMGATLVYAALVIAANLLADLALPLIDPRRR